MSISRKTALFLAKVTPIAILFLISLIQWSYAVKSNMGKTLPLIVIVVEAVSLFVLASLIIFILSKVGNKLRSYPARLILTAGLYFFALAASLISSIARDLTGYDPLTFDSYFFIRSLNFFFPIILVVVVYALVRNRMDLAVERENKLRAESLAQQARWMMLRYQVNPHFLFNALNTIRALIGRDDEQARKIVTEMSEYFRFSLSVEKKTLVTVQEEMNAVKNFLEIQRIRFEDRLVVTTHEDANAKNLLIPAFTIQTLAENAVKYGLKTSGKTIRVAISIVREGEKLNIVVRNTGRIFHAPDHQAREEGTRKGLENLKERLAFLDKDYGFSLAETNGMVEARVTISVKSLNHEAVESIDR
ncbi:MAG: histidine kinase [Bacteroides sp.]|jgi:sensor histidine kinase YesM|nr:histidine kinase [Bacteroides sp.]